MGDWDEHENHNEHMYTSYTWSVVIRTSIGSVAPVPRLQLVGDDTYHHRIVPVFFHWQGNHALLLVNKCERVLALASHETSLYRRLDEMKHWRLYVRDKAGDEC